jgi:hypothetical protein
MYHLFAQYHPRHLNLPPFEKGKSLGLDTDLTPRKEGKRHFGAKASVLRGNSGKLGDIHDK